MQNEYSKRLDSSLITITKKFVTLLRGAKQGVLDLKHAASVLNVQKRRIYDIINVLEGIGLLSKKSHSSRVQWRGRIDGCANDRFENILEDLKVQEEELKKDEEEIDKLYKYAVQNLRNLKSDPETRSYSYVTRDDIINCFPESTSILVRNDRDLECNAEHSTAGSNYLHIQAPHDEQAKVWLATEQGQSSIELDEFLATKEGKLYKSESSCTSDSENPSKKRRMVRGRNSLTKSKNVEDSEDETEIERRIIADIVLRKFDYSHSLRKYFPDSVHDPNQPFIEIGPPKSDYIFSLNSDEGVCELFDISLEM